MHLEMNTLGSWYFCERNVLVSSGRSLGGFGGNVGSLCCG